MSEQEYSESGDPIYNYENLTPKEYTPALGDGENIEAISEHIEKHVGKVELVFHEIISDLVHIDVHWVKPSEDFPFHKLITSGMSDMPMHAPEGMEAFKYAELCILLPADWQLEGVEKENETELLNDENNLEDENYYWPIRWLKIIARFPHEYDTWVWDGHSIPNGENAEPFADNTKLGCMILLPSVSLPESFFTLKINEEKTIHFFCLLPIYKEEMEFKLKKGVDALLEKMDEHKIIDVVQVDRKNTCLKKGLLGLW